MWKLPKTRAELKKGAKCIAYDDDGRGVIGEVHKVGQLYASIRVTMKGSPFHRRGSIFQKPWHAVYLYTEKDPAQLTFF